MRSALSEPASFLLDLIRFSAALLVVAAHAGHPEFHTGFANRQVLGDIAVPVFFVLSGFVIRLVTRTREHTLREFLIDRASRIYSIALPAMALTLALAAATHTLAPLYYEQNFAAFSDHLLTRVLLNLTFLSQSWSHTVIPFIDSPFWSLSYECLYYIAYGLAFYLRGWQRVAALAAWAVAAGPQVLFLLPIWWLGCQTYDLYQACRSTRAASMVRGLSLALLIAGVLLPAFGFHQVLRAPLLALRTAATWPSPLMWIGLPALRATMMAFVTGVVASVALFVLLLWSDGFPVERRPGWMRRFRTLADGTFTIYLMHYPLMVMATALRLFRPGHPLPDLAIIAAICFLLIALAAPLDALKTLLRHVLRGSFATPPKRFSAGPGAVASVSSSARRSYRPQARAENSAGKRS